MTLDALRLFEPRHAKYFETFCRLFYVFEGVYMGVADFDQWVGDEEFSELIELGMVYEHPISHTTRIRFRDFTFDIEPEDPQNDLRFIFGQGYALSFRGIELSKVLYPEIANLYWHGLRKDIDKNSYEKTMSEFMHVDKQYKHFMNLLEVILDDDACKLTIQVHQWTEPFKRKPLIAFRNGWKAPSKLPRTFYIPAYIRRFIEEIKK